MSSGRFTGVIVDKIIEEKGYSDVSEVTMADFTTKQYQLLYGYGASPFLDNDDDLKFLLSKLKLDDKSTAPLNFLYYEGTDNITAARNFDNGGEFYARIRNAFITPNPEDKELSDNLVLIFGLYYRIHRSDPLIAALEKTEEFNETMEWLVDNYSSVMFAGVPDFERTYGYDAFDRETLKTVIRLMEKDTKGDVKHNNFNPSEAAKTPIGLRNLFHHKANTEGAYLNSAKTHYIWKKNGSEHPGTSAEKYRVKTESIHKIDPSLYWLDFETVNVNGTRGGGTAGDLTKELESYSSDLDCAKGSIPILRHDRFLFRNTDLRIDTAKELKKFDKFSEITIDGEQIGSPILAYWTSWGTTRSNSLKSYHIKFLFDFFVMIERQTESSAVGGPAVYDDIVVKNLMQRQIGYQASPYQVGFLDQQIINYSPSVKYGIGVSASQRAKVKLGDAIARKFLDQARRNIWMQQAEMVFNDPDISIEDVDDRVDVEEVEDALEELADELETPAEDEEIDRLSDDERRRRNLVLKQCALMVNLPELSQRHLNGVVNDGRSIHKKNGKFSIYQGRFYMIQDGKDEGDTVNKLLIPPYNRVKQFVDIKPEVHAHLVPKIRIFRVHKDTSTGRLIQTEFIFPKQMDAHRLNNLKNNGTYDRGAEFGIKEFSFSFNGTNPATARNDIEAKLSLYFQSFKDFITRRNGMAYSDLIVHPKPDTGESINASHPDYYSAKNYRIKVDVGWELSSTINLNYPAPHVKEIREALQKTNKTYYLNRIDETIDFRDDGSVQINIDYRAYAETATKGTTLDALSTHESKKARDQARKDYLKVVRSNKCSPEELSRIQGQLQDMENLIKKQSYQSIYKRLLNNGSMNFARMDRNVADASFRLGRINRAIKLEYPNFADEDLLVTRDYEEISYFYLADLLYVIMDSIYDENDETKYRDGAEKFKFILSSFKYEDPFKPGQARLINIGSIPISNELFKEWFTDNVLKGDRNSYPIMYFVRDLCKYLITEILTENCFRKSLDKKFQFRTMAFTGLGNEANGCRMAEMYPNKNVNNVVANLGTYYATGVLPLLSDAGGGNNIDDMYHYILVFADGPKIIIEDSNYKTGNKIKDGAVGLYHYQIGRDRGLVKKMKFSKTDIAFLREARYFNNGFDGLMQLANVYKVTLEMIGNTLYYPGMEIYIDPVGFMGASTGDFNPSVPGSIANKLGFGGYHIVEKVNSKISPGSFTTTIEALFVYAGDGNPQSRYIGATQEISNITDSPNTRGGGNNCVNIVNNLAVQSIEIASGLTDQYESISAEIDATPAPSPSPAPGGGGE